MNKALADFQKNQMMEKQKMREMRVEQEMKEAEMVNKCIEDDEKMFRSYAEKC